MLEIKGHSLMFGLCRVDWFYWVQLLKALSTVGRGAVVLVLTVSALRAQRSKLGWYFWGLTFPMWVTLQHYNHQWVWQFTTFISSEFHVFNIYSFWEKLMKPANSQWHSLGLTHNPLHGRCGASPADLGTAPAHLSPGEMCNDSSPDNNTY